MKERLKFMVLKRQKEKNAICPTNEEMVEIYDA